MTTRPLRSETAAFDELAADYDVSFSDTRLGRWLRDQVWRHFEQRLPETGRIAEIGCGTGEDAVYLAQRGYHVVATDVSQRMLEIADKKARRAGCAERIEFRRLSIDDIGRELRGEAFDGLISNFGVFNCASSLAQVVSDIATVMKPEAPVICVVMGRFVPWEWGWYLARLDGRSAFRRLPRGGAQWRGIRVHYPTPRQLARSFSRDFDAVKVAGLGVFLPPSYAAGWINRSPGAFRALAGLERIAHRFEALATLADHFILEACRTERGEHA